MIDYRNRLTILAIILGVLLFFSLKPDTRGDVRIVCVIGSAIIIARI